MSNDRTMTPYRWPEKQGLYDPQFEHDSCGVGFVVNIKGQKSHKIVRDALTILMNLAHRGACGCEANSGDGAGILLQVPHEFFKTVCAEEKIALPAYGEYGVGMVYLPPDTDSRYKCEKLFEEIIENEGHRLLGWRTVPTNNRTLGETARASEPIVRQVFIARDPKITDDMAFERKLYVVRKLAERGIRYAGIKGGNRFYISSLSYKTIIYKGMLMPEQVDPFFPDLQHPALASALALVHSRFSTNTFPSWERAHPYRYVAHNGEINTLRGNINWMHARESLLKSDLFGDDMKKLLPIINEDGSDSAMFDNCLEFLVLGGRSLPHAMMMMVPEPWSGHESMSDEKKAFYEYHSCLIEPWDGPASIAFTDGMQIGAILDRNGLRPSRYYVTKDDQVIMASEVGVLDIVPERVLQKGRLQPGRMFLVDTKLGRIVADEELKQKIATERPYRAWLKQGLVDLESLPKPSHVYQPDHATVLLRQQAFGYTFEDLRILLAPMARDGVEPLGSMGTDTPLAVLSNKPQLLYNYFKQLFAQVTNPPIDCIREEIITSTFTTIGPEGNLLDPQPESCRQIQLKGPVLSNEEFERLRHIDHPQFKSITLPILFKVDDNGKGLEKALDQLFRKASKAIKEGHNILILSDRGVDHANAAIPALLAVAGMHHHLIRNGTRTRVGLVLESGEPREVHHFALLIGYGAGAINPVPRLRDTRRHDSPGDPQGHRPQEGGQELPQGRHQGCRQDRWPRWASRPSRAIVARRSLKPSASITRSSTSISPGPPRKSKASASTSSPRKSPAPPPCVSGSPGQWPRARSRRPVPMAQRRRDTFVQPANDPQLQHRDRTDNYKVFQEYSALVNDQSTQSLHLARPVRLEIRAAADSARRSRTGRRHRQALQDRRDELRLHQQGSSRSPGHRHEPHRRQEQYRRRRRRPRSLPAHAQRRLQELRDQAGRHGRFGVTSLYLTQAKELQIKMAQGAKPGEGGELPGAKVYPWIAKVRHSTPGVGLISPPPHHDIYSIEDLAELIHDLKNANRARPHQRQARLRSRRRNRRRRRRQGACGRGAHQRPRRRHRRFAAFVHQARGPPVGTRPRRNPPDPCAEQSPQPHRRRDRRPAEDRPRRRHRRVARRGGIWLRHRAAGHARLHHDARVPSNTCPVGVATQDPQLRNKFTGDPQYVVNFMRFIAQEVRELMAQLGFRTINEMVGRVDRLDSKKAIEH